MSKIQKMFVPGEITNREHCHDRVEPFVKHGANPIFKAERLWEGSVTSHPTVMFDTDEGLFKMWYETIGPPVKSLGVTGQGKVDAVPIAGDLQAHAIAWKNKPMLF